MSEIYVNQDIALRNIKVEHADEIYNLISRNRHALRKWLPFVDNTLRPNDTRRYILQVNEDVEKSQEIVFEVWFKNQIAGLISYRSIDYINQKIEIGYWLSPQFEGKGIITLSVRELIRHAFNDMNINRIYIRCGIENTKSSNIPKRLNFKFEGIERDGQLLNGKFIDLEVYSLLKVEWMITS
ncbi:MAG: GNAT family protein [Bacteroidota bacterium]|nr:GNAT family protein [Bacteroidota bacterium]MDP4225034.1 GNAT family protein [Bacteroidota bacterium]MDP4273753.1 GNAT family protein [Bacteroidota bacterium]